MLTRLRDAAAAVLAFATLLAPTAPARGADPETPPATPTDAASPPISAPESRDAALAQRDVAQQTLMRLTEEERYAEAVTIAAEIVDLTTRVYGEKTLELATPLSNLATAQMRSGDLVRAETNYRASIAIIEAEEDLTSMRLINPLVGLAETYMRGGLYEPANATYRRALQTNHVQNGFYNLEQVNILDGLSESYVALDKLGQANTQQRIQVDIAQRRSGPDSPDVIQAMRKLGLWYNRTGQYLEAHLAFQDTRRMIQQSKSGDTFAMVDTLLSEAITYGNEGADAASADSIKRALGILDAQAVPDHAKHAEALVALGDSYMRGRQPRSGRERYAQAWQELSGDDSLSDARDRYFAKPTPITMQLLPTVVDEGGRGIKKAGELARAFAKGFVIASMTINVDGDASNITVLESSPPGLMDKQILRTLEFAVFRPQMTDGSAVPSEGVQFRHDYLYPQPTSAPAAGPSPVPASDSAGTKGAPIHYPERPDEPDPSPEH